MPPVVQRSLLRGGRALPDDSLYVLELARPLDRTGEIACDWREGDVWWPRSHPGDPLARSGGQSAAHHDRT